MSLNMMTPSGRKARHGCRRRQSARRIARLLAARACNESSIAMSGVSERARNGYLSEYLRTASALDQPSGFVGRTLETLPCSGPLAA